MKTKSTVSQFIEAHRITVRFVPLHVAQETESEFKTWQLHYTALVTVGTHTESFSWHCGYGCALNDAMRAKLKKAARGADGRTFCPAGDRGLSVPVVEHICGAMNSPSRLRDQAAVRVVMQWLLANFTPDAAGLIDCLKLDAGLGEYSFRDFCGEIGGNEDSRRDEATWRACQENGRKLRGLIGAQGFAELLQTESL
jgi:hypothetical protein